MRTEVKRMVERINRRRLTNNTQKTLLALLTADNEWVSRSSIRVPSVGSRLRDLRKEEFGGFRVECARASDLERKGSSRQTFYRLDPNSVTVTRVAKVFEGVIVTQAK